MNSKTNIFHDISTRIVKLINVVLMTAPFVYAWYTFYADLLWVRFFGRGHWLVILLFVLLYFIIGRIYEAFKMSYNSKGEMIYSQVLALFEVDVIMYIVAWLLIRHVPAILPMLMVFGIQIVFAVIWSYASQTWYFRTFPANKTVIIWDTRQGISKLIEQYNLQKKYKVVASMTSDECISNIEILEDADAVFIIGIHSHERNIIAKYCLMHDIKIFLIPRVGDMIVSSARRSHLLHLPLLKIDGTNLSSEYLIIKRICDIFLSIVGIIITSPIMLIFALSIKIDDGGPILYRQTRLTKDGKEFKIIKFRSMYVDAEKDGIARLSSGDSDDRITRVGRIIRKTRIDELPQLVNVLKGNMSLVGPRAERPEIVEEYLKELPEFALRVKIKAGLTGYAQVYGKYNTTPYDKLLMDLMYMANASIFEDLRIMFLTLKVIFMRESTEGIDIDQTTALDLKQDK